MNFVGQVSHLGCIYAKLPAQLRKISHRVHCLEVPDPGTVKAL
jgi:hypothetical protein